MLFALCRSFGASACHSSQSISARHLCSPQSSWRTTIALRRPQKAAGPRTMQALRSWPCAGSRPVEASTTSTWSTSRVPASSMLQSSLAPTRDVGVAPSSRRVTLASTAAAVLSLAWGSQACTATPSAAAQAQPCPGPLLRSAAGLGYCDIRQGDGATIAKGQLFKV